MAELSGVPLQIHLENILSEYRKHKTIYGFSERNFFRGYTGYDFSASLFGSKVVSPLGPAAGPHTQLAQNILLSFLHGSRIIELKTIQILDQLKISRPCIDIRNIGYNIEWSQELPLEESLNEYINAWILIHLIKDMGIFSQPADSPFYEAIFDISVGYDFAGISSPQISEWIRKIKNAGSIINEKLSGLGGPCHRFKNSIIPSKISESVTLSTFHGCPAHEIESIVEYLLCEQQLNVVVKMNPTLLGFEDVSDLLHNRLGYNQIELDAKAFENDLNLKQAIKMMKRLNTVARAAGKTLGAKFTNTLVTKNNEGYFTEKQRYLSGAPLYVLAMNSMFRFRELIGSDFPVSFSGGINKLNFSEALSCNMVPVTTCTDILKKGGYKRLSDYLGELKIAMDNLGVRDLHSFIVQCAGYNSNLSLSTAGQHNASMVVQRITELPEYSLSENSAEPKKIDSRLSLFDCLSCNICLPVCPNAANFDFFTGKQNIAVVDFLWKKGQPVPVSAAPFILNKETQIGNIAEFCNNCGNCETFCPESGGPQNIKPRFFLGIDSFNDKADLDGFYFETATHLHGRLNGEFHQLILIDNKSAYEWCFRNMMLTMNLKNELIDYTSPVPIKDGFKLQTIHFHYLKILLEALNREPTRYPVSLLFDH